MGPNQIGAKLSEHPPTNPEKKYLIFSRGLHRTLDPRYTPDSFAPMLPPPPPNATSLPHHRRLRPPLTHAPPQPRRPPRHPQTQAPL